MEKVGLKRDRIIYSIIEFGILGLLVFSPLPAGSVPEWSVLVIELTAIILLLFFFLIKEKPLPDKIFPQFMKWPKYFFSSFLILIFLQIMPLPTFLVKIISPSVYSFKASFSPASSVTKFMTLSIIPSHTLKLGLEIISYFIIGYLILKTTSKKTQILRIIYVSIAMGMFEAFYGLFELYNKNPRILFYRKIYHLDSVTGTFVNRNHFSGYLEMIIPLVIGIILARIYIFSFPGLNWREKVHLISEKGISKNIVLSCGVILMSISVLFSKSRSGVFILILCFILFFGLISVYFGVSTSQKRWIRNFILILFLFILIISIYTGIDATIERFALDNLLKEGRPVFWGNSLRIFSEYPIFGTGLGTFPSLYPDIMEDGKLIRIYHAHNDFLEYLCETGILGFIFLFGGVFIMLIKNFILWQKRRHPEVKGLALGGIIASLSILIHSLTDFNLHIPANILLFSIILSLTTVIVHYKK